MFLIRAFVVLLVAFVSITRGAGAGGESRNDRLDDLFSLMYDMGKQVYSLSDSVKKIYGMEEETAEHMLKTEDRVSELVQKEDDMSKKVGKINTQMVFLVLAILRLFLGNNHINNFDNINIHKKRDQNATKIN